MCIAIVIPKGATVNKDYLHNGWCGNSDGGGFALDVLLTTSRVHFVRVLTASSMSTATAAQELNAHPFEHDDQDEHD